MDNTSTKEIFSISSGKPRSNKPSLRKPIEQNRFSFRRFRSIFRHRKKYKYKYSVQEPLIYNQRKTAAIIKNKLFEKNCDNRLFSAVCYSNLYFYWNKSLFGCIIQHKDVQYSNNISFQLGNSIKSSRNFQYMPVYKRNVLCNFPGILLLDFSTLFRSPNVIGNVKTRIDESSYKDYAPMINYNSLMITEYFPRRNLSFKVSRVCYSPNNVIIKKLKKKDFPNLDEISPVECESPSKRFMTIDDLEKNLIDKKKKEIQRERSERNILLLEPLLLQDVSYKYSEIFRQKQQEFKKNVRLMISYSFLCFILSIIVFLTLYLT